MIPLAAGYQHFADGVPLFDSYYLGRDVQRNL